MLFEKEPLTPKGRLAALNRLFTAVARKEGETPDAGHVPVAVLEAHGELSSHVRFMLNAAANRPLSKEQHRQVLKIERLLDSLPESVMTTLPAGPDENWLLLYRKLIQLHGLIEDIEPEMDAEEYTAIVQKIVLLASAVAQAASVAVNAASMFTLLLIQVHLHKHAPVRRRRSRKSRKPQSRRKKEGA